MKIAENIKSILILLSIIISSCSSMNRLTMSVTEPAPVYVPANIETIAIIDRSLPKGQNVELDKIDKILSAEGKNLDQNGANESVTGLFDELISTNRFDTIKIIDKLDLKNPGLGAFPSLIPWERVDNICKENNVDAIFVLSFYDTDATVDYQADKFEMNGPGGIKIPIIEHHARITTFIKTGWRIYDPVNRWISDEYQMNDRVISEGVGVNPVKAAMAIIEREELVLQSSNNIGHIYAQRIFPYKTRVSRDYYVRGTDNFKIAKRRAQTGNWDSAAELWDKEVLNPKAKIAGRACYNMAIINEINGNLEKAVEWATKSYTDYKDKEALRYLKVLNHRVAKDNQLKQEMGQ